MTELHLLISDLLLPAEAAPMAGEGLSLSALETLLARAGRSSLPDDSMEAALCRAFEVSGGAIAPIALQADGISPLTHDWLRADPVYLSDQRGHMVLYPEVFLQPDEAAQMCGDLNRHFADGGIEFFAPHPTRWYVRLRETQQMQTVPPARVANQRINAFLPQGTDALRWLSVANEIQMLFYEHPVNQAREARGLVPVNSVWFWGGGRAVPLGGRYTEVWGDYPLAAAFAQAAGLPYVELCDGAIPALPLNGRVLVVLNGMGLALQRGDLQAWRSAVQQSETYCQSWLSDLRAGRLKQLTLDAIRNDGTQRFVLLRTDAWKFWRKRRHLAQYSLAAETV
ncbi:MAG: hypothetical protein AB1400_00590 [Pseudomonadota bacterium]